MVTIISNDQKKIIFRLHDSSNLASFSSARVYIDDVLKKTFTMINSKDITLEFIIETGEYSAGEHQVKIEGEDYIGDFYYATTTFTVDNYSYTGSTDNLITHEDLSSKLKLSKGTSCHAGDITWLKFENKNTTILISDCNLRHSISWDELQELNCGEGAHINIKGFRYACRLITFMEWDECIVNHCPSNDVSNWSGMESMTKTTRSGDRLYKYSRGNKSVSSQDYWSHEYKNATCGWRPVLELVSANKPSLPSDNDNLKKLSLKLDEAELYNDYLRGLLINKYNELVGELI
ncbi:MAG: hypothetical protein ACRCX2_21335 [Paraclostridium sp.]